MGEYAVKSSPPFKILLISTDSPLTYLIGRYAERSGYRIETLDSVPPAQYVCASKPALLIFPSIESLESAQPTILELSNQDVPVLVCSSVADEARARELGADYCLLHPVTYDGFTTALAAARTPIDNRP
jgi:DNA-binding response OmpR family regulator